MFKQNRRPVLFLVTCFVILFVLQYSRPKPVDWTETYKQSDKMPYGTQALYKTLPGLFPDQKITTVSAPVYNALTGKSTSSSNYIVINRAFEIDSLDLIALLNFVKKGNTAFIAAKIFASVLSDTLKFKTEIDYGISFLEKKDSLNEQTLEFEQTVNLNFYNPFLKDKQGYRIETGRNCYFSSLDTARVKVIGGTDRKQVNFIQIPFGKGSFFLLHAPEALINFNYVNRKNSEYASKALNYLPQQEILWDEYYKVGRVRNDDTLNVIMSKPALSTAYYVLIISLLLFVLVGIKRKQRIIPVIEPLRNTTLDFVDTIGTLYYQNGTHKDISEKQISHFLSYIHKTFRVDIANFDNHMITKVANRSGIEPVMVNRLFDFITALRAKQRIDEHELLQLNAMIEYFYKQNKR